MDYIKLYELLCEFEREEKIINSELENKTYMDCKTKEEFAKAMLYADEIKAINLIKELLSFNF